MIRRYDEIMNEKASKHAVREAAKEIEDRLKKDRDELMKTIEDVGADLK